MSKISQRSSRRQQILESLADMLSNSPGTRITTAALAKQVGVSEAALYRHFPSKSKMFEALIEFIEETIFTRIKIIASDETPIDKRCERILVLLLTFAKLNPGISRILTGDALAGESERAEERHKSTTAAKLRARIVQFFDRLESQLKQLLREAELRENVRLNLSAAAAANLMMSVAEGRISQFVRSEFKREPTENWTAQWPVLIHGFFRTERATVAS